MIELKGWMSFGHFRLKVRNRKPGAEAGLQFPSVLFRLIGYGATGLFPCLQKEKAAVDELAKEYIEKLKEIK